MVAFVASSLAQSWSRDRALADSHGGVTSLATPPRPAWESETDEGRAWALGDTLVTVQDGRLVGLDVATGRRGWEVGMSGGGPRCGPAPEDVGSSPAELVCLVGDRMSPRAWVVTADGQVTSSVPLGDVGGDAVPGPGASVLRWDRTGGTATVMLQDAKDAGVRWVRTVAPDDVARVDLCRPQVAGTAAADVEQGLLVVRGCRISAYFDVDGTRVDDTAAPATLQVVPTAAGTYLRTTAASATGAVESTQVVRNDGATERIVPGRPLVPLATDGTADPTRLLSVPGGVQALDTRGNERWTASGDVVQVAVVADGVAVLDLGWVVRGVDLATGATAWTWERDDLGVADSVVAAFTDRHVAALVVAAGDMTRSARIVALDLADGSVLWDQQVDGDTGGFGTVDGHLVHADPATGRLVVYR